jgi:holo-[acyl-carrier protein] synthase
MGETALMSAGTAIRVGADVAAVHQVADSVARFGDRYLGRVYTEHEIASCAGSPSVVAAGLAARFAAKEATIKVLRPIGHQPDWRSIEVRKDPQGWCSMSLSGHAATLADEAGIDELEVSLTHDEDVAAAVVVALCHTSATSAGEPGQPLRDRLLNGAF